MRDSVLRLLFCVALLVGLAGCAVSEGGDCAKPEDCASGLTCGAFGTCETRATIECEKARDCAGRGRCKSSEGECIAASTELCAQSENCKLRGICVALDGDCRVPASSDAECESEFGENKVSPCDAWGSCTADNGVCVASSDADCKRSFLCTNWGQCTAREGKCVASKTADCKSSRWCKDSGTHCVLVGDVCALGALSDADCGQEYGIEGDKFIPCAERGDCTVKDGRCIATKDSDCKQSDWCKTMGMCSLTERNSCSVGSDADCRLSESCRSSGKCTADLNSALPQCKPGSRADCVQSELCKGVLAMCDYDPSGGGRCR